MDEATITLFAKLIGLIVATYGAVIVWIIRRLLRLEDDVKADIHPLITSLAVMEACQTDLRKEWERGEKRNNDDHNKIMKRIDDHHSAVVGRIDNLTKVVKNGN